MEQILTLKEIFWRKIDPTKKAQIYNTRVLCTITYGAQTWSLRVKKIRKIAVTQRTMEIKIIGVTRTDKINNKTLRDSFKTEDVLQQIVKWNGTGPDMLHELKQTDGPRSAWNGYHHWI